MSGRIISDFFFRTRTSLLSSSRTSLPFDRFKHTCSVIIMPYQQRRGGFKEEQKWREKPNVSSHASGSSPEASSGVDAVTNRLASMSIATPPLQFGTVGVASHQKGVWRPKSYATVSEPAATPAAVTVKAPGAVDLNNLLDNFTVNDSTYSLAQIRATFYPKFENEKSDQEVRTRMIEMVSKGLATLEVSLKHSGSLFMYAGHQGGAYAKNSYGNIYTAVGVFVLGRTFREAWGIAASQKQAEFSDFLESNRMCISMELVTAVLGDHGQRPRDDYVVVTAVTELGNGKPKFYSTPDIIAFCRKWRLPTNHVWLFSTRKSVASFFASFDALCEEGTASTVCKALNEVADISVPGTKDHIKVQGEILEGLVARIVSHASSKHMDQVLHDFPPPPSEGDGLDLGPSLREICAANRSNEKQQMKALLEAVGTAFCPDDLDWFGKERTDSHSRLADRSFLSKFLQTRPADFSTTKFQEMVRLMRDRRHRAAFKCYPNFHKIGSVSSDNLHFKMVIHVHSDSVFRQYQKEMRTNPGLWPLYRGFFVDLNLFKVNKEKAAEMANNNPFLVENGNNHNRAQGVDGLADEDANLMIKLKFLTYKLRTFLIRNGLSILFKQGPSAYKTYYQRQMKIWNTSPEKQRQLSKMLDEWAVYIRRKYGNKQLSSSTYLSEAEPFLEQYARRSPENQALIGSAGNFVHAEDFMAIVDGGRDEEGDLETEKEAEPSSPSLPSKDVITKDDGLIIFFPGIPGCAKSALCKELLNTPGVFGDGRPVHSLMGDLIKGKYWDKVNEQHRRKPKSIMLADKNAPNEEVWSRIEEMCRRTKSYAVPVVPDSEGSDSNPYSIDALAVFMFRVLQRVNHPGNLDKNSKNPGYVLLMFYDLYDGKSREEFERELIDRFGSLVKMPLLKPDRAPLPDRVKLIIEEGMDLYKLHQRRHGRSEPTKGSYAPEWAKWEKRLAETLSSEANYLNSIQVPFQDAVSHVVGQLKAIASGSYKAPSPSSSAEKRNFATIVFAAVSLPVNEIQTLLEDLARKHPEIKSFLAGKNLEKNMEKAHVTLAHKRSHGVTAVANYGVFLNQPVPVQVTALLFSDNMAAALETRLGSVDGEQVVSKNPWPHVTLWTADGVGAKEANRLPELFAQGKAARVEIVPPKAITGVLRFY